MARYLANLTNGQLDEKGIFRLIGTLLTQSGVIQSGALQVAAQDTPDMTVKVAGAVTGHDIVFITSDGSTYHGWNTSSENVTITANASGVTKTDAIVAYADLAAGISTSNNPGALKFVAVRRGGSDTGNPTSGEISSAVSSNPYVVLAYVTVANGASSINSGNITDARTRTQLEADRLEPIGATQIATATTRMKLAETVVSVAAPTITISGIPATYRNLLVIWSAKNSGAIQVNFQMRFNGDTGNNYHAQYVIGNNTTATIAQETSTNAPSIGTIPGSSVGANVFNHGELLIPSYSSTGMEKQYLGRNMRVDSKASGGLFNESRMGHWASTASITSITFIAAANNIVAGSVFTVYGDP